MHPRTPSGGALRRGISLRCEEPHLRVARSIVTLLQPGGNRRLQMPPQSTLSQRGCQILALSEVGPLQDQIISSTLHFL